ncbi:hypothetical protein V6N13_051017 [Hibiscus sabdariffa]|uniref:Uncharacterized protein n=1 Tax=Hibiscus sabdariffa TaxID=183260 RepID=A0ABR2T2J2_9ROSI
MPGLINLGRLKKQQHLAERSFTEATLTKDSGFIQAEERLSAEITCPGRREESKKGLRIDQNILLNIPVQRARLKEAEITQRKRFEAHAHKDYLEYKFQPKEVLFN